MRNRYPTISLIGPGRLGDALLTVLGESGYPIESVFIRHIRDSRDITGDRDVRVMPGLPENDGDLGEMLFITTPDDTIRSIASDLASKNLNWKTRCVAHCSGALSSSVLDDLRTAGAQCASFHPLQTFPTHKPGSKNGELFSNVPVSIEGDKEVSLLLEQIAGAIGGRPVKLNEQQKRVLHVAAVFISNYNVALASVADELIRDHLGPEDHHLLDTLMMQTTRNITDAGPSKSLTGPVARGDVETVKQHLELLTDKKEFKKIYKILGSKVLDISVNNKSISVLQAGELKRLLK